MIGYPKFQVTYQKQIQKRARFSVAVPKPQIILEDFKAWGYSGKSGRHNPTRETFLCRQSRGGRGRHNPAGDNLFGAEGVSGRLGHSFSAGFPTVLEVTIDITITFRVRVSQSRPCKEREESFPFRTLGSPIGSSNCSVVL